MKTRFGISGGVLIPTLPAEILPPLRSALLRSLQEKRFAFLRLRMTRAGGLGMQNILCPGGIPYDTCGVLLTYYRGSVMIIIYAVGEGLAPPVS